MTEFNWTGHTAFSIEHGYRDLRSLALGISIPAITMCIIMNAKTVTCLYSILTQKAKRVFVLSLGPHNDRVRNTFSHLSISGHDKS